MKPQSLEPLRLTIPTHHPNFHFSPDSNLLYGLSANYGASYDAEGHSLREFINYAIVWDTSTGEKKNIWIGEAFYAACFSPDSRIIAFNTEKGLQLWNATTGTLERQLSCLTPRNVFHMSFSPDGNILAIPNSFSKEPFQRTTEVSMVDVGRNCIASSLRMFDTAHDELRFLPDGKYLVGLHSYYDYVDGIYLWDLAAKELSMILRKKTANRVAVSRTGRLVAFARRRIEVREWWEEDNQCWWDRVCLFVRRRQSVFALDFSYDESLIAAIDHERADDLGTHKECTLSVWDIESCALQLRVPTQGWHYCMAFAPNRHILAVASGNTMDSLWWKDNEWQDVEREYTLSFWNTESFERIRELQVDCKSSYWTPRRMQFSPDGRWLAVGHNQIDLWDMNQVLD